VSIERAQLQLRIRSVDNVTHVQPKRAVKAPRFVYRRHVQREMID
jgi:hypothetical protein